MNENIEVGAANDPNPFVMGSFLGGYSIPGSGTPLLGGYGFPAYGYAYIPPWALQAQRQTQRLANPSKKSSVVDKVMKKARNKTSMMTVVNPTPPRPVPVPPGFYSKTVGGKTVIVCPPKKLATPTVDPFEASPKRPRFDSRTHPQLVVPPPAPRRTFPGGVQTCAEACSKIYHEAWQFPDWQDCYSRCSFLYEGPGPRPNPGIVPKLGGKALKQRADYVLSLLIHMRERDYAAQDARTAFAIRALKTARTSQERREAIAIARSLIADWDRWDGSRRFTGQGAVLAIPTSDDELRLVVQPVTGQLPRMMICGSSHCCVIERPGDLWRCIREIRGKKKTRTNPQRAKNPTSGMCHCDNPRGTDCKCTVCWQEEYGYKPSCITFPVPDQSSSSIPSTEPTRTRAWYPAQRRHSRQARTSRLMNIGH